MILLKREVEADRCWLYDKTALGIVWMHADWMLL